MNIPAKDKYKGKGKGKVHPRTGHVGLEEKEGYSSTLSLTWALHNGGHCSTSRNIMGSIPDGVNFLVTILPAALWS